MLNKKRNLVVIIVSFLFIFLSFTSVSTAQPNQNINISVEFHSSSVIREGYEFPASVVIRNLNENESLNIKKITIMNRGRKAVKINNFNKELKSLKKDVKRLKEIIDHLRKPEFIESLDLLKQQPEYKEYKEIISRIKNETF